MSYSPSEITALEFPLQCWVKPTAAFIKTLQLAE